MEIDTASAKREQKKQNDQASARPPDNDSIVSKQIHVSLVPQVKTIYLPMASFFNNFFNKNSSRAKKSFRFRY